MGADGMTLFVWGPASVRRNDLFALGKSQILVKWAAVMVPGVSAYVLYGDSIYPLRTHLRSKHGAVAGPLKLEEDSMNSCRVSIENGFSLADQLFPFLSWPSNIKLMSGTPVREIYLCKYLFTNMYSCLYGNQSSGRFALNPPTLESYMAE